MTLALIRAEIDRFLLSTEPEVLCIQGKWGVGKTFAWKQYLSDAVEAGNVALENYAYVSLFGLGSLDQLRYSIFENTVGSKHAAKGPDIETFGARLANGSSLARKLKPALEFGAALFGRENAVDVLAKASFLTVREQIVCLDDLERAGKNLEVRDVLGLASSLKEERNCKVVLLLNDEQMDAASKKEFNAQLEKVADLSILFDLTPKEATQIALPDDRKTQDLIRPRIEDLGIVNIRVIKKIERLADVLLDHLKGLDEIVLEQAIATLTATGWSIHQPEFAPPTREYFSYNPLIEAMRDQDGNNENPSHPWAEVLKGYPYFESHEMDEIILVGAKAGYFDGAALRSAAEVLQHTRRLSGNDSSLSQVWKDKYHGSLTTEDDEFIEALYGAAVESIAQVSITNLSSAIYMLREYDTDERADNLIGLYMQAHDGEARNFFDIKNHIYARYNDIDQGLRQTLANKLDNFEDHRDPFEVLKQIGSNSPWNDDDLVLMSKQTPEDFEKFFEELSGPSLKITIEALLAMGKSNRDGAEDLLVSATEALRRIGRKSPMRERKVKAFGISLEDEGSGE
ncbi:hypothetical protein [Parasphingorhabdus cellanae]|uniref:KAP NTPase domain-containing protein n=1 Tax=Parasphingorhabdus cellanae TaxID=2806553 RepID=A0ABX7T3Q5_9SPHN|nr:hypothetical protein [Parasphingorhabdus cellanae]QTD54613.1 hypothetical protein J4G78_10045 [Parasphingorhabdus cellanae]